MAYATSLLLVLACTGAGLAFFHVLGLWRLRPAPERLILAFPFGLGILGWLVFPLGVAGFLQGPVLGGLCVVLALGNAVLLRGGAAAPDPRPAKLDLWGWTLVGLLALAILFDGLEALAPPSDGDTLAYQFARPKEFLEAGRLVFAPSALDTAIPFLIQMTYLVALALGGETGLTLWSGISGLAAAPLLYVLARPHLSTNACLALVVLYVTTPAVVYGAGSGQVEPRLAAFALVAMAALAEARNDSRVGPVVAAGMAAGFYAGSKYLGLIFLVAVGMALVLRERRLSRVGVFAAAAFVSGVTWYAWNFWHTGDPIYPMLHVSLGWDNPPIWPGDQTEYFRKAVLASWEILSRNPITLITYPFLQMFSNPGPFGSGRTGLGPIAILVLPLALGGMWRARRRLWDHPLAPYALVAGLFYVLFFFVGGSQKVRHLLPIYPAILLCLIYAATRFAESVGGKRVLAGAIALTIGIQIAGHALFTQNFAIHIAGNESRDSYFQRTVTNYDAVRWMNENLSASSRVLFGERQFAYLMDVPYFFAHPANQRQVDYRGGARDPALFSRQLKELRITHVLRPRPPRGADRPTGGPDYLVDALVSAGCMERVASVSSRSFVSRTLPTLGGARVTFDLYEFSGKACAL